MTQETFGCPDDVACCYLAHWNQGNRDNDSRNCRCNAYVCCLAQPASRFILPVGVTVRCDLKEK